MPASFVPPPLNDPPLDVVGQFQQSWARFFQVIAVQAANSAALAAAVGALAGSPSYANDAAAAAGGVKVGALYRNGSVVQVRVT